MKCCEGVDLAQSRFDWARANAAMTEAIRQGLGYAKDDLESARRIAAAAKADVEKASKELEDLIRSEELAEHAELTKSIDAWHAARYDRGEPYRQLEIKIHALAHEDNLRRLGKEGEWTRCDELSRKYRLRSPRRPTEQSMILDVAMHVTRSRIADGRPSYAPVFLQDLTLLHDDWRTKDYTAEELQSVLVNSPSSLPLRLEIPRPKAWEATPVRRVPTPDVTINVEAADFAKPNGRLSKMPDFKFTDDGE
jgi:hypothetical protein